MARLLSLLPPRAERLALAPLGLATALFAARAARTGDDLYAFLLWNLVLACVPAALALAADALWARGARGGAAAALAAWLLFLPNAPYLLTDFVHLRARPPVPLWYDVALLGAAALAGLALGAASLARVHGLLRRETGPKVAAVLVLGACLASGYGIYLGRFLRLNSWDAALHPMAVASRALVPIVHPIAHWHVWAVTAVFGAITAASYLAYAAHGQAARVEG